MGKIAIRRNGLIHRDGIHVGWIDRNEDGPGPYWQVRLKPASGPEVFLGAYERLREARAAAKAALEAAT